MIGQGIEPRSYHPLADRVDARELERFLGNIQRIIRGEVNKLPAHADFIARNCAAPGAS
jgi:tryptophan halogenase